jgi:hypothetical protein
MAKWLMHAYESGPNHTTHPGALHIRLDDHRFIIPPNEPFEVESDYYAHHIMAIYGPIYGVIELPVTKTRTGVVIDPEAGLRDAQAALVAARWQAIFQYARIQMEDRVRSNLPTLPPTGFAEESVRILGVNLQARFGFSPLGWDTSGQQSGQQNTPVLSQPPLPAPPPSNFAEMEVLRDENRSIKSEMAQMKELLEALLEQTQAQTHDPKAKDKEKGKEK